ncbi:hypothetical protein CONLIGDRAFT_132426 [Coniochaeta ligniaria NRRL 30616]|uniref:Uncharacterized protein n=1 Tax=Coniochaeta ligniaria NRRL 30616 TaxID=1408157 RepID=A0A1J7I7X0_9PEZI|nr:hypothetical protein CONLIGDRAFT_132426 [Coniochaeta ligniaria NRRL 30616]
MIRLLRVPRPIYCLVSRRFSAVDNLAPRPLHACALSFPHATATLICSGLLANGSWKLRTSRPNTHLSRTVRHQQGCMRLSILSLSTCWRPHAFDWLMEEIP